MNPANNVARDPQKFPLSHHGGFSHHQKQNITEIAEKRLIELDWVVLPTLDRMNNSPVITHAEISGRLVRNIKSAILEVLWKDGEYCSIVPNDNFKNLPLSKEHPAYLSYTIFCEVIQSISHIVAPNTQGYHEWSIGVLWRNNMVNVYCSKEWFSSKVVFILAIQKIQGLIDNLVRIADKGVDLIEIDRLSYKAREFFRLKNELETEN